MSGPPSAAPPGMRLGPYELVRELGSGGFASVWLARRRGPAGIDARVAIKRIRVDHQRDPVLQRMFRDEANLAARIHHPNVVRVFELAESEEGAYLVMEYVAGRPLNLLDSVVRGAGEAIPVGIVLRIIADTCAGLHAAHELERDGEPLGVVHLDVSPQNILVSDSGTVKLIDFGVARANDRLASATTDGPALGKRRYMAPEQALARPVDRRADIWSAGAVAFGLIEGRPPHDGQNELIRLFELMDTGPPPTFTSAVPPPIARVIRRALERDPDARWATAAEMGAAIEAALDACELRVNTDSIVAFFGDALSPIGEDGTDPMAPKNRASLHVRLQRHTVRAGATTADVPAPAASPPAASAKEGSHVRPGRRRG